MPTKKVEAVVYDQAYVDRQRRNIILGAIGIIVVLCFLVWLIGSLTGWWTIRLGKDLSDFNAQGTAVAVMTQNPGTIPLSGGTGCPDGLPKNQAVSISSCVVLGDVTAQVNGSYQSFYDQGGVGQGTVLIVKGSAVNVLAPFGAGAQNLNALSPQDWANDQFQSGCGNGCSTVRVVVINNGTIESDQTYSR